MSAPMVPCNDHGDSAWCFLQDDWGHMDSEKCACTVHPVSWCQVDAHRHEAESYMEEWRFSRESG